MKPRIPLALRSPTAAIFLALAVWPSPARAQLGSAEIRYHRSLQAYNQGRYDEAMEGFMDVLLDDPSYPDAQKYLSLSGQAMMKEDQARVYRERRQIFSDILKLNKQRVPLMKQKAAESKVWAKAFKEVLEHAQDPKNLPTALLPYQKVLEIFPLYAEKLDAFLEAKSKFHSTYDGAQWRASQGDDAGKRAYNPYVADALKVRKAQFQPSVGHLMRPDTDESEAAGRIGILEEDIERQLRDADTAFKRFEVRDYDASALLWQRILKERPLSLEARYYLDQARSHLAEAEETAAIPDAIPEPPAPPAAPVAEAPPAPRVQLIPAPKAAMIVSAPPAAPAPAAASAAAAVAAAGRRLNAPMLKSPPSVPAPVSVASAPANKSLPFSPQD